MYRSQIVGEFDPAMAPLLLSYGKALYELAYSQAGVMGQEEVEKQAGGQGELSSSLHPPIARSLLISGFNAYALRQFEKPRKADLETLYSLLILHRTRKTLPRMVR